MTTFFPIFHGRGRVILAEALAAQQPFELDPAEIVEKVLALGFEAEVDRGQSEPFRQIGTTTEIRRGAKLFLVTIGADAESIAVQEVVAEAYPPE